MNQVDIQVRSDGYEIKASINGKEYIERWERDNIIGGYRCVEGNFEKESDIPEELYDALSADTADDIARALVLIDTPDVYE